MVHFLHRKLGGRLCWNKWIIQDIFDEIVLRAMNHKMVWGRVLLTDPAHLKVNAKRVCCDILG
jgi:hypothetical protein